MGLISRIPPWIAGMILTATAEKVETMASRAVAKFACVRINLSQFTIVDRLSAQFRRAIPRCDRPDWSVSAPCRDSRFQ